MDDTQHYAPKALWHDAFFATLALTGNVTRAAEAANIERKTAYLARERDPAFRARWADALDEASDRLEEEARRRAYGVDEPVIFQGEPCVTWVGPDGNVVGKEAPGARLVPLTVKKYSDGLLMFLLKACRPEKYRERQDVSVTSQGGGPVRHELGVDHGHHIDPAALAAFHADLVAAGLGHLLPDGGAQPVDAPPTESGEAMQPLGPADPRVAVE
jgi:hypothetical protein